MSKIDFETFERLFNKSKISKVEFGKIMNVKPTALQAWFDRRSVPVKYLYPLADFFKTNPKYLIGETRDETRMQIIPILGNSSEVATSMVGVIKNFCDYNTIERYYYGEGVYGILMDNEDMNATIKKGSVCLCNPNDNIVDGNVVHFSYGDINGIRRYKRSADGTTTVLVADNIDESPIFISWDSKIPLTMVRIFRVEQEL